MNSILEVVLPFFALVGVGFFAARRGLIGREGVQGLATFVYWFAIPLLLFRGIATRDFGELSDLRVLAVYLVTTVTVFFAGRWIAARFFRVPREYAVWHGFGSAQANNGFLAIPLMPALFGEPAIAVVALTMFADMLALYPLGFVLADLASAKPHSRIELARSIARTFYTNPYLIAMLLGAFVSANAIVLPGPVSAFVTLTAQAGSPTALFALGASLALYSTGRGRLGEIALMNVGKLVACPLLIAILGTSVIPLPPEQLAVAIAVGALPTGINLFLISQRYVAEVGIYATAILASTAISVASFSAVVWLVTRAGG